MTYVKAQGGQTVYPYSIVQLRKDNPRVSFPKDITDEILREYGVHFVEALAPPAYDEVRQRIEQNTTPEQNQEKWVLSWSVVNLTDEEVAQNLAKPEAEVRGMRDEILANTDWTQVVDTPVDQAAWAAYRQALRDVPAQAGFPDNVTWPVKP